MTVTLEIPEELGRRLGPEAARMSREALALEALRQGLWSEAELARFLSLSRFVLDQFLKDHGVELAYTWDDLERERAVHRELSGS
jgi:predicted HTH domain antitoxin